MSFRSYRLKIKAKTWKRDSYGLFDYETTNCSFQDLSASTTGKIFRHNHQLNYIQSNSITEGDGVGSMGEGLVNIVEAADGIKLSCEPTEQDWNQLWVVLHQGRSTRDYALKVNDVIKFGRVRFKVTQIKVSDDKGKPSLTKKSIIESLKDHMQALENPILTSQVMRESAKGSTAENLCKICLYDKSDFEDDPLISPCKCIGSVKHVHLKCMQNWVKSKLNMQQNRNIVTIFWKNLQCELCKEKLPINLLHKGENLCLIPFDNKITGSYIMMESFSKEKNSTGIHLVDLSTNQNFKIGRGHDCELKLTDISVSRIHAIMMISKGKVYLKDNNSKFGTLVLQKDPLVLNSRNLKSPWLQCGRTFFRFSLKKPWFAYIPCVGSVLNSAPNQIETEKPVKKDPKKQKKNHYNTDDTMVRFTSEEDIKNLTTNEIRIDI